MTSGPIVLGVAGGKEKNKLIKMFSNKLKERGVSFFMSTEPAAVAVENEPDVPFILCIGAVEGDLDWFERYERGYVVLTGTDEEGPCFFRLGENAKKVAAEWEVKTEYLLRMLLPDSEPSKPVH